MPVIIKTRCPHCGSEQNSYVVIRRKCVYCGRTFILFPKNQRARVYEIVSGSYQDYLAEMNRVYHKLRKYRERVSELNKLRKVKGGV